MTMSIQRPLNVLEDNQNQLCQHHKSNKYIYTCKDCEGVLACTECVTTEHHGHRLVRMHDNADSVWKDLIHHYIYKGEKIDLPKVNKEIKVADRKLDESKKYYQEIAGELTKRGDELKQEIDRLTHQALEIASGISQENAEILQIYKHALLKQKGILEESIKKCKQAQGTQDFTVVFPVEKHIRAGLKLPKVPFQRKVSFTPEKLPNPLLDRAYGIVQVLGYKPKTDLFAAMRKTPQFGKSAKDSHTTGPSRVVYTVESQFRHHADITNLCCTTDDCSWVANKDKKEVLLVSRNGEVKQTVELDVHIGDMSTSQVNGNLWFSSEYDYSIREVTTPTTEALKFRTPYMPRTMAMSGGNRVVTATFRKVSVYDVKGEELYCTDKGNSAMQKVASPDLIRACPMSGNIAVLDQDEHAHGGLGRPHITVLTGTLGMLFQYYGSRVTQGIVSNEIPKEPLSAREGHTGQHHSNIEDSPKRPLTSRTPKKSESVGGFKPTDICYDAAGHLFIADQSSRSVVMISSNGQFLKTIYTDHEFPPKTISFQTTGVLWVGFDYGIVKVIKYKV